MIIKFKEFINSKEFLKEGGETTGSFGSGTAVSGGPNWFIC